MHAFVDEDLDDRTHIDDGSGRGQSGTTSADDPAGTYTLRVVDDALDLQLPPRRPRVDVGTTIGGTGTPSFDDHLSARCLVRVPVRRPSRFRCTASSTTAGAGSRRLVVGRLVVGRLSLGRPRRADVLRRFHLGRARPRPAARHDLEHGLAARQTLRRSCGSRGKLLLTYGGIPVVKVKAWPLQDHGRRQDAGPELRPPGKGSPGDDDQRCGRSFGTYSVTLTMTAGQWSLYSSAGPSSASLFTSTPEPFSLCGG